MQFSAATLAFFVNLALAVAVPEAAPAGMVQKLDARDVSENLIFGRIYSAMGHCMDTSRDSY
ncbi:hypothetical protein Daus18300_004278 [Diaporthe australafricana]|uniref:Uncharacterized protein n=1 Tax=Diaporthe australafricana TaxID=127596 RepID=A0ABR3X9T6_9PEZI